MTKIFANARLSHLSALLAAGAALAFAAPVQAQDSDNQVRAPSGASAAETPPAERRICVNMEMTGSRLVRRVCRTPTEWNTQEGGVPN